jgi:hypothetical protein
MEAASDRRLTKERQVLANQFDLRVLPSRPQRFAKVRH